MNCTGDNVCACAKCGGRAKLVIHVRVADVRRKVDERTLCGLPGVNATTVSHAWGFWGPTGRGFPFICPDCYRIECEGCASVGRASE